eukprot:1741174-Amphidinium_carterae.3
MQISENVSPEDHVLTWLVPYTRFMPDSNGATPNEKAVGQKYTGSVVPWGSWVMPKHDKAIKLACCLVAQQSFKSVGKFAQVARNYIRNISRFVHRTGVYIIECMSSVDQHPWRGSVNSSRFHGILLCHMLAQAGSL